MNARAFRLVMAAILVLVQGAVSSAADPAQPAKKLIEFGWDEPDTAFLRAHIGALEQTPFDGCVFHVLTTNGQGGHENLAWLAWGRRAFAESEVKNAVADLKATPFQRFTHNFLRVNTAPADLDWFDDHAAVRNNARLAAAVARSGPCAGVLLDVEEYQGRLFTYSQQRDAKTKSWDAYATQARVRGREVMDAFREGFPGLTVFVTFGHSLPRTNSKDGKIPLAESDYGLLAPFLDGMVEAARGGARIVDGFELSYGYRTAEQFEDAYRLMHQGVLPIVGQPDAYQRVVSAGFGLWLDFDWRKNGWNADNPMRNYFTPDSFATSLRRALARSDEYVWVYTETPRWWSADRGRVKLPDAYEAAIRRVRKEREGD